MYIVACVFLCLQMKKHEETEENALCGIIDKKSCINLRNKVINFHHDDPKGNDSKFETLNEIDGTDEKGQGPVSQTFF